MMGMDWDLAHFARPDWLWLAVLPPLVWLWRYMLRRKLDRQRYRDYADPALLEHLLVAHDDIMQGRRSWIWVWSLVWWLGVLAMAGPRWDYMDVDFDQAEASLVVVLDISRSMDVTDVSPSRIALARREVEDLINSAHQGGRNLRIGLVAFASTAHVVAPITDDSAALRQVLPYLGTSLSAQGGSRLLPALNEALRLMDGHIKVVPDSQPHFLLVSDGDFDEPGLEAAVGQIRDRGIRLHVLGVGTPEGGPVIHRSESDGKENQVILLGPGGVPITSRLTRAALQNLAEIGNGYYLEADYAAHNASRLLAEIDRGLGIVNAAKGADQVTQGKRRIWNERYYWPVGLILLLILPWYLPRPRRPH